MRVAMVTPLPPSRSGIADYAATLAEHLGALVTLDLVSAAGARWDPSRYDAILYQVGNNPWHDFVYELALEHPGVVVLHEANLHHLLAELLIRRGDWDAYLAELEYNGGPEAAERGRRVRAGEIGPDYDGVPMLRRLLERSRALVVHSRYVAERARDAGFQGPIACIPHGAWIPEADRMAYRSRLGLDESTPLIGIFGHLKPYKRIPESLRAFRRLVRLEPRARMVLAGEPHPDLPLAPLLRSLDLEAQVRLLGHTPLDDFTGYMAACDIVVNLRYPTVGETSGSLLRAMGLGKAVLVSDVGAFAELPDEVCLKVGVGPGEEDLIFEYLNVLVSRPDLARGLGERARAWVEKECAWPLVARRYASFLEAVAGGRAWDWAPPEAAAPPPAPTVEPPPKAEYVLAWTPEPEAREYVETHRTRLETTLAITPAGGPGDRILEMGAYLQITPALHTRLGYGEVRGCYLGPAGRTERHAVVSEEGERFECEVDLFDAERDRFPYPDGHFATVLCCEVLEHLASDPMHMLTEINRVLRDGGHLVLSTPNIASLRALAAILQGYHPGLFTHYLRPERGGEPRHHREYTPREVRQLVEDAGFTLLRMETGPYRERPRPEFLWVRHLLERYRLPTDLRDEAIYVVARKCGPVRRRYPEWLYTGGDR